MIKLTNAGKGREGDALWINKDWIISVYENARDPGGSLITVVFGGTNATAWEVEESLSEVIAKIKMS